MMSVAGLDSGLDWTFGKGKANYKKRSAEILQNVITRIKSFKFDWFADINAYIDWFTLLGNKDNQQAIVNELQRVILSTDGVAIIDDLSIVSVIEREVVFRLQYTDIFSEKFNELIRLSDGI